MVALKAKPEMFRLFTEELEGLNMIKTLLDSSPDTELVSNIYFILWLVISS